MDTTHLGEMQAILNTRMFSLRKVDLNFEAKGTELKKIIDSFSAGAITTLESITVSCYLPPENSFHKLVDMNKYLRNAKIGFYEVDDDDMQNGQEVDVDIIIERVIGIAESFLQSTSLTFLDIHDRNGFLRTFESFNADEKIGVIEELFRTKYRHRRAHVSILEKQYS